MLLLIVTVKYVSKYKIIVGGFVSTYPWVVDEVAFSGPVTVTNCESAV